MKLTEIAKIIGAELLYSPNLDLEISNISIDSRLVKSKDLFVAIYGGKVDGHDFIPKAKANGAVAALVSRNANIDFPQLKVDFPIKSLGKLGAYKRKKFTGKVIGVTGSVGKTTTKTILASILSKHSTTFSSIKSYNTDATLPLMLWQLQSDHQFAVLEMGASYFGEIAYLTEIAKPDVAIILNAVPCHTENFGDLAGISQAKGEIMQGLSPNGTAILNLDDQFFSYWKKIALTSDRQIFTFGLNPKADITASEISLNSNVCPEFNLHLPDKSITKITLPLLGEQNVMNALAASAAAFSLGLTSLEIKTGLESVVAPEMRLAQLIGFNGANIINDCYNANPASVAAALKILALKKGPKIFIFADMRELGENTLKFHEDVGKLAQNLQIDYIFAFGDLAAIAAKKFGKNAFVFANQDELVTAVKQILQSDSNVLVKGSRSMNLENVVKKLS